MDGDLQFLEAIVIAMMKELNSGNCIVWNLRIIMYISKYVFGFEESIPSLRGDQKQWLFKNDFFIIPVILKWHRGTFCKMAQILINPKTSMENNKYKEMSRESNKKSRNICGR